MSVVESGMNELGALVNKAVGRAELKARKREKLSLQTTIQFLDAGGVKFTQLGAVVTLTQGQAEALVNDYAARVLRAQVRTTIERLNPQLIVEVVL